MHRAAWLLQVLLAIYFVATGLVHFVVPEGLPTPMQWMDDLSTPRGEIQSIVGNVVVAALLVFVAHVRTRVRPIRARDVQAMP